MSVAYIPRWGFVPVYGERDRDQEFRMSDQDRKDVLAGRKVIVNLDWKPRARV